MTSLRRFRPNEPRVVHETIDGEVVLIDFDTGNYYSLDGVGAHIWSMIEGSATVAGIAEALADRYEAQPADIETAVGDLIAQLQAEGLIVPDADQGALEGAPSGEPAAQPRGAALEAPVLHKYTDMQALLLLEPIHEVCEVGWPSVRPDAPGEGG
jgi:hypothetical protein